MHLEPGSRSFTNCVATRRQASVGSRSPEIYSRICCDANPVAIGKEGTRYEVGTEKDLLRIRGKADVRPLRLHVSIVQPGLWIAEASRQQLELLAVTENYLKDTFAVHLEVVTSER
jgi:hypothetical protein